MEVLTTPSLLLVESSWHTAELHPSQPITNASVNWMHLGISTTSHPTIPRWAALFIGRVNELSQYTIKLVQTDPHRVLHEKLLLETI
ncbi:hypothetical protein [Sphingobacterium chungjuense]|uniref:hypothetical protein n=1 Tax=Sphingobacterium chungjuense TaxID=2675553 RepID=UPI00140E747C|nr:hypothetical protein [Sphingobacterium chungjuense]